jgi:hypothetical protein
MITRPDQPAANKRPVQAFYQALVAERFGQDPKGAGLQYALMDYFVREGGNENDRRAMPVGNQPIL